MAVAIWALVTNKIALPREVATWKDLYNAEKADKERAVKMAEDLTQDLRDQRRSHEDTLNILKAFQPRNRRHDDPAP